MDTVGFVVIGLLIAVGVVRHWRYADNPFMRSAEDATTITGRQWGIAALAITGFVLFAAICL